MLSNSEIELCKLTANVYEPLSQTIKKCRKLNEVHPLIFFFFFRNIMILGHGANTMTMEEAKAKLCAQAKYVVIVSSKST